MEGEKENWGRKGGSGRGRMEQLRSQTTEYLGTRAKKRKLLCEGEAPRTAVRASKGRTDEVNDDDDFEEDVPKLRRKVCA